MRNIKSKLVIKITAIQIPVFFLSYLLIYEMLRNLLKLPRPFSVFAAFVFAAIALYLSTRKIAKAVYNEVHRLTKAAERYASGRITPSSLRDETDEWYVLNDTMKIMASTLQERIDDRENEKTKLSAVLENMAEGVIAVNRRRQVILLNPAAARIFRYTARTSVIPNLLHVTRDERIDTLLEKAIQQKKNLSQEIEWVYPEAKVIRVQAIGTVPESSQVCGVLVLSDITEIRHLELVRRDFVANVSHELRTPLTSIKGFIETLLNGAFRSPEQAEAFLKIMDQDAERLTRLIDDLLELSKIESKKISMKWEKLDLRQELDKAISRCQGLLQQKKVIIENHFAADTSFKVRADADKLQQVLINLLDNAIKFSPENGKVVLNAKCHAGEVTVTVEDEGPGIPADAVPRIFERFFRVDKGRSREMGGTGLGLSIVKHIVEAHGGHVSCTSVLGKGSKFAFTLEAVRA